VNITRFIDNHPMDHLVAHGNVNGKILKTWK